MDFGGGIVDNVDRMLHSAGSSCYICSKHTVDNNQALLKLGQSRLCDSPGATTKSGIITM